tara:strand:- start:177 stop:422 length:246 start_codon:yes stop_codon:yes gene_type:complete
MGTKRKMREFIALVFIIWFVWYLIKASIKGNSSHSSKIDSRSSKVDYRDYGPIKRRDRNVVPVSENKELSGQMNQVVVMDS